MAQKTGNSRFPVFKITVVLSVTALLVLFLPFAKSVFLSVIFAFGIIGAKDRLMSVSEKNRIFVLSFSGLIILVFVGTLASLTNAIFSMMNSVSDPLAMATLKSKISALYSPSLLVFKKLIAKFFFQFGNVKSLEAKFVESINLVFDALISFVLKSLTEVPANLVQFLFFIFLVFYLIRKMTMIRVFSEKFLKNKENYSIDFFISTGKKSGYFAVVITMLTASAQAFLLTMGALVIGIPAWHIVFVSAFISAMFPFVGVLPVGISCAIYAATELDLKKALIIILFGLTATVIDNILRPILMAGDDSNINPLLCFFALIGAISLFGFSGLFIGPFVLVFASSVFQRFKSQFSI